MLRAIVIASALMVAAASAALPAAAAEEPDVARGAGVQSWWRSPADCIAIPTVAGACYPQSRPAVIAITWDEGRDLARLEIAPQFSIGPSSYGISNHCQGGPPGPASCVGSNEAWRLDANGVFTYEWGCFEFEYSAGCNGRGASGTARWT